MTIMSEGSAVADDRLITYNITLIKIRLWTCIIMDFCDIYRVFFSLGLIKVSIVENV